MRKIFKLRKLKIVNEKSDKWINYSEGYKEAANLLKDEVSKNNSNSNLVLLPLMFIYRHYFELKLKEIIVVGNEILHKNTHTLKGAHDLNNLWKQSQQILQIVWKGEYTPPHKNIYLKIQEIHQIDLKSDSFRYPTDKKGNDNLAAVESINIGEFEELIQYFEETVDGLYHIKDISQ